ncbi:helix-turn-helix domain-containing protein [Fluviicola chungangensis]|uniref:Helix-turn-helix domain-containing protein n=1 Tax=Fluviicola chungangensis TaxID=2597671 RepID=A0A556N7M5_9FLAO|nr:helix-turn-helix domain-containing protein [Fluviicola chungangensis]TSJ48138.1 helix-turn-helix domain-containing protein [Fluviicola chungangensis]
MERFVTVKPKSELIAKYISYYYFHDSDEAEFKRNFVFYPHFKHGFTVYNEGETLRALYTMNYNSQISVELNGAFQKIGVAFNPLGMNYFVSLPVSELYDPQTFLFQYWNPEIVPELKEVFQAKELHEKRDLLDSLFERRFRPNPDLEIVKEAVNHIFNTFGTIRVDDLALQISVSRKTLLRHFKRHLGCSIEEYKKVVKFRTSIQAAINLGMKNLTEVSLYSLYYDQSDFTNRFKELTGQTPGTFFASVQKMGEEDIFWKFDE